MIDNQTLISRAEQYLRDNFQYQVLANDVDITHDVKSIAIETTALDDEKMEPITGQATLVLTGDHRERFSNETNVKIFLKISDTEVLQVFAGYSDIQTQANFSDVRSETTVKIFDYTNLLKKKRITKQVYTDVVFCNHDNQGNSLLHILLSQVNLQNTIAVANNNKSYPLAVIDEGTLYYAVLKACHSAGCVFDYTSGFFRLVQIAHDTYTPVYTLDRCERLTVDRLSQEKKNPIVYGYDITQTNQLVYTLTYKTADSPQECFIPISAGGYWPSDGKAVAEIESEDIIKLDNPTFSIATASGGSVVADDVSVEGKKIKFRLKNTTGSEQTVIKCRISADVVKIVKETRSGETINTSNPELKQEWTSNYFIDGTTSQTLANRIAQRWKARSYKYSADTYYLPFLEIGDIIQFQDTASGTNATCFVHALKHYISPAGQRSAVQLINVEAVSTSATSETLLNQTPLNVNVVNATTSVSLQEVMATISPSNASGYSGQGWTTTPETPTIKSLRTRNNFVTLEITPQPELSNFDRYEYQISKDNGGTWANLAGTQGQVEISYLDNWQFIVQWNTDSDGKAIDTQVKIRVRRKTKAGIYSDWAYTDNITLQASISAITNNLGQVYCDSVVFDQYNYIAPSAFRLGGASSYIQYAGGDLSLQGAGIEIGQGDINVSGDITAGGIVEAKTFKYANIVNHILYLDAEYYIIGYNESADMYIYDINNHRLAILALAAQGTIGAGRYIDNAYYQAVNYDGENEQSVSELGYVYLRGKRLCLGTIYGTPPTASSPPGTYAFLKAGGIIEPHSDIINSQPNYYARLAVGEMMKCQLSWSNSTATRYIPLRIGTGVEKYEIQIYIDSGAGVWCRLGAGFAGLTPYWNGWWREQWWVAGNSAPSWGSSNTEARICYSNEVIYLWTRPSINRLEYFIIRDGFNSQVFAYISRTPSGDRFCDYLAIQPLSAITRTATITIKRIM